MYRKFFLMLIGLSILFSGCEDKVKPGMKKASHMLKIAASTDIAKREKKPFIYECTGTIESGKSSRISSKLMGVVKKVYVREGDQFQKDDLLVEIDDRQVKSAMKQAESALEESKRALLSSKAFLKSASARLNLSKITYKRYQKLLKEDSVSAQEFDEVEARYKQAEAEYSRAKSMVDAAVSRMKRAEAAYGSAKVRAKDSVVLAPYKGRITKKMIESGDLASPGTPLFDVEAEELYQGVFFLPENYIQYVAPGEKIAVSIPSSGGGNIYGVISRIDPSADQRTRTFKVKVDLESGSKFSSGVFARGFFPVGERDMILVPESAIVHHGQLIFVYIVDDKNIVKLRLVRRGSRSTDQSVEILSGLNPGEKYITHLPANIKDGAFLEGKNE